jgi:hypothetical protein
MVNENTHENRKRLAIRSTDFAQAQPFSTLLSEQDASSNKAPIHTHLSRRMVLKRPTGRGSSVEHGSEVYQWYSVSVVSLVFPQAFCVPRKGQCAF